VRARILKLANGDHTEGKRRGDVQALLQLDFSCYSCEQHEQQRSSSKSNCRVKLHK